MYTEQLKLLSRSYRSAKKNNDVYDKTKESIELYRKRMEFLQEMHAQLNALGLTITEEESSWRESVLSVLESEIIEDLEYVYPTDGYRVKLSTKVLRGKIHIDARVYSTFASEIPGKIRGTQGRLFQQVVSFSGLIGVMLLLGIRTIYIDEAFSGSSKKNIKKLNKLLNALRERGFNLIMIAQDTQMADNIPANHLILSRSVDNKTTIVQKEES